MDYLLRDDAFFSGEEWDKIDEQVLKVASEQLIGRRVLHLYGPLGAGVQSIHLDTLDFEENGEITFDHWH